MSDHILEVHLDVEGRYVGANDAALEVLGYTADELRTLAIGALSATAEPIARQVWEQFLAGEIHIGGGSGVLRRRDGTIVPVLLLGVEPHSDGSRWVSRMALPEAESPETNVPRAIAFILADWRQAERDLAATAPDDPARGEIERRVAALRLEYQQASRR